MTLVAVEPGLGGVDEQADDGADDDEVEEHLDADDDACAVRLGGDVAEADGREHGDDEVEGTGVVEWLTEMGGRGLRQGQVHDGEDHEEQRDRDAERLDCAQPGHLVLLDPVELQGEDDDERDDADYKTNERLAARAVVERDEVVRAKEQYPGEDHGDRGGDDLATAAAPVELGPAGWRLVGFPGDFVARSDVRVASHGLLTGRRDAFTSAVRRRSK